MLAAFLALVSLALALACLVTRQVRIARLTRALGFAVLACGAVALVAGLGMTWSATSAPGLSEADRMRMTSNGVAEATYSLILNLLFAAPAVLSGHWVLRKNLSKDTSRPARPG
jgi:hypothetical protein